LAQQKSQASTGRGIFERIADVLPESTNLEGLSNYLQKVRVEEGQVLAEIDGESDEIFFLESCAASAFIIDATGKERRVAGAGRGAVFGEIGFLLGIPRTALVRADSAGEIYTLRRNILTIMEQEEPELASAIVLYLAKTVTERLVNTTRSLRVVI
jgi:SulP family sulfate permease